MLPGILSVRVTCPLSQLLIESIDDLQMESHKLQHFDRNAQRQKAAQQQYLQKKKIEAQAEDLQGKPEQIIEKIVSGRVSKIVKTKLLLEQPYIRDPNMNVDELVKSYVGKLGENIKVARFVRFNVGETQDSGDSEDE